MTYDWVKGSEMEANTKLNFRVWLGGWLIED